MAKKKGKKLNIGKLFKFSNVGVLPIIFFSLVIYAAIELVPKINALWSTLSFPRLNGYENYIIIALVAVMFGWIAKKMASVKLLKF